jgi:hypothetical protein
VLQLYIEGATYDDNNDVESWVTTQSTFKLWVIGDVERSSYLQSDGVLETGTIIKEVTLAIAFFGAGGSISITPDPDVSGALAFYTDSISEGTLENDPLKPHGIYPNSDTPDLWENYALGDFTSTSSDIGDFAEEPDYEYPTSFPDYGQINVYDVVIEGWERVHFDAFAPKYHYSVPLDGPDAYHIAPYSHDAVYNVVPEPGTFILLGGGLIGVAFLRKRLKKN